jgi:hypothetical protein
MGDLDEGKSSAEVPPLAAGQIEIWKKIVDVQQHFNDLELRIRNFALIVTGAFLGLGGYAIKDGGMINALGAQVSVAGLVVLSAVLPLIAFYFMDRLWYHRLLDGAVAAGVEAEEALKALGYKVDLGSKISAKSPFVLWLVGKKVHSKSKMDIFYGMLLVTLLIVAGSLSFGIRPQPAERSQAAVSASAQSPSQVPAASATPGGVTASAASQRASMPFPRTEPVGRAEPSSYAGMAPRAPPTSAASEVQAASQQASKPQR